MKNHKSRPGVDYKFLKFPCADILELPLVVPRTRSPSFRYRKILLRKQVDKLKLQSNKFIHSLSAQSLSNLVAYSEGEVTNYQRTKEHLLQNKIKFIEPPQLSSVNRNTEYFPQPHKIKSRLIDTSIVPSDCSDAESDLDNYPMTPTPAQRDSLRLKSIIKQEVTKDLYYSRKQLTLRDDINVRILKKQNSNALFSSSQKISSSKGMVDQRFYYHKNIFPSVIKRVSIKISEQHNKETFIALTNQLKSQEVENGLECKQKIDKFLLKTDQSQQKKQMKQFISSSTKKLMKLNLESKQQNLNNILSILQQPLHLNSTIQEQCQIEHDFSYHSKINSRPKISMKHTDMKEEYEDYRSLQLRRLEKPVKLSYKQIRMSMLTTLQKLKRLHITPADLVNFEVFSLRPFQKPYSYEFMQAAKLNDLQRVQEFLHRNKYLVYDFDHAYLTSLHWVAKRGFLLMARLLIMNGADCNAKDIIGRTPLFLAVAFQFTDLVQLLLYHKADPWSTISMDYSSVTKSNSQILNYITISRKIHILLTMSPPQARDIMWQKEATILFCDPEAM